MGSRPRDAEDRRPPFPEFGESVAEHRQLLHRHRLLIIVHGQMQEGQQIGVKGEEAALDRVE
ncbi:hypothetical protein ACIHFD_67575 [Nonomuraea sp. NPDC051941]|uniref:hypothetical protein n=1 Tax=Nonomuraea sp. NPDC051941 TaxID=3364373 RepID=UPI0037CA6A4B